MRLRYGDNNHIISYVMIKIRQYTAISVIVNIVYIVDDRDPSILQRSTINNCNCNKTKGVWDTTINSRVVSYIMPTLNDIGQRSLPSQILYPPRLVVGWSHTKYLLGLRHLENYEHAEIYIYGIFLEVSKIFQNSMFFGSKFTDEVYHQQRKTSTKLSRPLPKTDMLNLDF